MKRNREEAGVLLGNPQGGRGVKAHWKTFLGGRGGGAVCVRIVSNIHFWRVEISEGEGGGRGGGANGHPLPPPPK